MLWLVDLHIVLDLLLELVQPRLLLREIGHRLLPFMMDSFVERASLGLLVCEEILMGAFAGVDNGVTCWKDVHFFLMILSQLYGMLVQGFL